MITLAKRENNIQQIVVVENVIPPPINDPTQPRPARITVEERHTIRDGCSPPHDVMEYHSFALYALNSQRACLMVNTQRPQDDEIIETCHMLEKSLKAIEGRDTFDLDALNTCLVPGLVIPQKLNTPDFEKYKRDSYLKHHLVMFYQKLTCYAHDDKLMIHYFQDSLTEASLSGT